jgi:hypothetical protein
MTTWTDEELSRIGTPRNWSSSRRADGSLRPRVTMWVVRVDDGIYVRSAGGPERPWYRYARASATGSIRAGGLGHDVTFGDAAPDAHAAIDAAYHSKYDRYGPKIVGSVVGPDAEAVTIQLHPCGVSFPT